MSNTRKRPSHAADFRTSNNESHINGNLRSPKLKSNNPRQRYTQSQLYTSVARKESLDQSSFSMHNRMSKQSNKYKKIIIAISIVLISILLSSIIAVALYINNINNNLSFDDKEEFTELCDVLAPVVAEDESSYALILGSDAREKDTTSRSDVIILARLDPQDGIAELVSIPRDTMVEIPDHGINKINAAYAFGGPAGAVECVSEFAGVPISHYVEVHFEELKEVVDRLGGIMVDIPEDIKAGNGGKSFSKGEQLIDGEEALAFARERYNVSGGDFGRAHAQRMILTAIVNRVIDAPVTEIPSLVTELSSCISTDFTVNDLIDMALKYNDMGLTMYTVACPSYTYAVDGISYVATMFNEWQDVMKRVDAGLDPKSDASIPEPQNSNDSLGAATNSPAPRDYEELASHALSTYDIAGEE